MEITIIGSGTCVPSLERSSACIRVVADGKTVLFDTGPGTLRQLLHAGTTIQNIDLVCYSHLHVDHIADLVPLLFASKYGSHQARERDLAIMGAPGIRDFYQKLTQAYGSWIVPEHYRIHWTEIADHPVSFDTLTLTSAPVDHTPESIAIRLQDSSGATVVYSGDTDYCDSIAQLARDCDVLILECSFPDGMKQVGHLTPELAGRIATNAGCRKLVVTHFYPPCETCDMSASIARHFSGEIIAARDLLQVTV